MQDIGQTNHLNHSIAERLSGEGLFGVCFPEFSHSSAPVLDVQKDQILILLNVDLFIIDSHGKVLRQQGFILIFEQVKRTYLGVYKFIAELREEELRVLLSHIMEIFADLSI